MDIVKENGEIEIVCEFCNAVNVFDLDEVERIFK